MKINYNIPALRTLNELSKANTKAANTMQKLSSGLRINRSADDAAGLAIANKMDAQVKGLQQANRNTMDGISLVQTAEGALNEVHDMLQRMRELSVQAANGTYSETDTEQIQQEIDQLCEEINRVSVATEFNEKPLLNGDPSNSEEDQKITLQIGANKQQTMVIEIGNMNAKALGLEDPAISVATYDEASAAITKVSEAIEKVSAQRAALGAVQNRLEHTTSNLGVSEENMTSSLSRIQDADMAYEMAQYTQLNVLSQAATAMLAQANQRPQQVMQLLQR